MAAGMTQQPKVLIVDDNRDVLASLRRTLRRCAFSLFCVDTAQDALHLLETESFDLLLSDIDMPGMDGHALMERARALQPTMIRVFVTGAGSMDAAVRAINEGEVHRFVRKPFDAENLRQLVTDGIARKAELDMASQAGQRAGRRKQLYLHLESEHPGITTIDREADGTYVVDCDSVAARAAQMGLSGFIDER